MAGALIALAIRAPSFGELVQMDASAYLAGGFAWTEGLAPYRDIFDHKGPLNAEIFVALDWLLPTSATAVRLLLFAAFVASMAQLSALVGRHAPGAAWPAVVIYAIAGSSPLFQGQDLNTEQIALPLLIAAADLADRARLNAGARRTALLLAAGAGVAVVAATGLKSIYAVAAAPIPSLLLLPRPRLAVAAVAAGTAAAVAILAPYAAQGLLDDMRFALLDYSRDFASLGWEFLADEGAIDDHLTEFPTRVFPIMAVLLGAVALADPDLRRFALIAFVAALGSWIAARAPGYSHPHYFVLTAPAFAVLCGAGAETLARRAGRMRLPVIALVIAPLLAVLAVGPVGDSLAIPREFRWGVERIPALSRQDDAAEIVRDVTAADERIYVMTGGEHTNSGQAIYWEARRLPASGYIFPQSIVPPIWTVLRDELAADPPSAIVHMPGAKKGPIKDAIENGGLREIAALETGDELIVTIYARRSPPPGVPTT